METQPVDVTAIPSPAQSVVAKSPELAAQEKRERYQGHKKQKEDTVKLSPNATTPASGTKETKETKETAETELDFETMELFSDTEARGKECRNDFRIYITLQCLHFENHSFITWFCIKKKTCRPGIGVCYEAGPAETQDS